MRVGGCPELAATECCHQKASPPRLALSMRSSSRCRELYPEQAATKIAAGHRRGQKYSSRREDGGRSTLERAGTQRAAAFDAEPSTGNGAGRAAPVSKPHVAGPAGAPPASAERNGGRTEPAQFSARSRVAALTTGPAGEPAPLRLVSLQGVLGRRTDNQRYRVGGTKRGRAAIVLRRIGD